MPVTYTSHRAQTLAVVFGYSRLPLAEQPIFMCCYAGNALLVKAIYAIHLSIVLLPPPCWLVRPQLNICHRVKSVSPSTSTLVLSACPLGLGCCLKQAHSAIEPRPYAQVCTHVSGVNSRSAPGVFHTYITWYFYNHAHGLRLEKRLYQELSRSPSEYF
jgi:hypothetical protein